MVLFKLPNELIDAIIRSVGDTTSTWLSSEDKQTLLSCALVHRDWLPATRHALLSHVDLRSAAAWDSFLGGVIKSEEMRPWLASIYRLEFVDPLIHTHYPDGKRVPPGPTSAWRGQYVLPVLAGYLPNLHSLALTVDWAQCQPHPTTFNGFSHFASLRHLLLSSCSFPSFCTFRRVLVLLPVLKDLSCQKVHWPSAPQLSTVALRSRRPALESFHITFSCHNCTFALLEWLVHTPTSSTVVEISFDPSDECPQRHHIALSHKNLDYYIQIFAPSIRVASLCHAPAEDIACLITLSQFVNLKWLRLDIRRTDWSSTADMLGALPGGLETLYLKVSHDWKTRNSDLLVKEDGEFKVMVMNGLELLDPALSSDNFKDLSFLHFYIFGYCDTLPPFREKTLESMYKKLLTLYKRKTLDIQLGFQCYNREKANLAKCRQPAEWAASDPKLLNGPSTQ